MSKPLQPKIYQLSPDDIYVSCTFCTLNIGGTLQRLESKGDVPIFIETLDKTSIHFETNFFQLFPNGKIEVMASKEGKEPVSIEEVERSGKIIFKRPFPVKSGRKGLYLQFIYRLYNDKSKPQYTVYKGEYFKLFSRAPKQATNIVINQDYVFHNNYLQSSKIVCNSV